MKSGSPVSRNDIIKLQIEDLNHEGEGVGRYKGFTVFAPGAAPGDEIIARVISVQKNYARALLQDIVIPSPFRVTPSCPHYTECGGCQLQHISYPEQLRLKQKMVQDAVTRIAGLDVPALPIIGADNPWQYRNKAQLPVGWEGGKVITGFYARRTHRIVNLQSCRIQHPANDLAAATVRRIIQELNIPIYNESRHTGLIRHILARTSFTTGEILLVLITNGHTFPWRREFVKLARNNLPNLAGIVQNINTRRGNVILGTEEKTLWGKPFIIERIGSLSFRVSSRSFFQVNPGQTEKLYAKAKEYAALTGKETVFDLYCGTGTISLFLADRAAKVVGVEITAAAVEDARANAALNAITNAEFHAGPAEKIVPALFRQGYHADVVVVDPPRKGCDQTLLQTITAMQPARLVYISCNPATLARDLAFLYANGFQPREIQPVDMFPHTYHVECVTLMSKVEK
ncbi:MAG: 23S rRNA (uracil(1939)-C(5))-methyltransferase RlmD [Firmicutes bacterium]|nr:23S rRNA (uracil(1939)-C(5))-methyltransferase RlmD [Bacillota bacterium]